MAENKKSFLLYIDIIHTVIKLTDTDAGQLFKHILKYVNDQHPKTDNIIVDIAFEPIRQSLKRDLIRYEEIKEKRSKAGKISAETRQQNATNSTHVDMCQQSSTNPTVIDSVIVSVIDNKLNKTFPEKPEKVEKIDFIDLLIQEFSIKFKENRGVDYFVSNQKIERSMAGKLLKEYKKNEKNKGKTSDQTIKELSTFFESCMLITDKYINETMSLSTIINQFNKIVNILRNGNKQRKNEPATSNEQLANVFAKHFATDYKEPG